MTAGRVLGALGVLGVASVTTFVLGYTVGFDDGATYRHTGEPPARWGDR